MSAVADVLRRHWGYDTLRPWQGEAIDATLAGRDVLTVLPTGGGKSLCFQIPPLVSGRLTVVVSPLIALMRDQVAGLRLAGVAAGAIHGHTTEAESAETRRMLLNGQLRLLYVAPERLLQPRFIEFLRKLKPGAIAVDESHCISQWGHDFRPEYRRLAELRAILPGVPIGAYTATATPRVRKDIAAQLHLENPVELVGCFDRPNLTYRVLPRTDPVAQIADALRRHTQGVDGTQAAIVYCLSRKETERVASAMRALRFNAQAYHAGMSAADRTRVSEAFRDEALDVVVATVAFGMGIDRGDVRCVIHATMPKSIEHYQQETGRAGRDGLPAECLLLYSGADAMTWRTMITDPRPKPGEDEPAPLDPAVVAAQLQLLDSMHRFAHTARCRHRALSEYFGQDYTPTPDNSGVIGCGGCDVCLEDVKPIPDAQDVARKIISCVARCAQSGGSFGVNHLAAVLTGSQSQTVLARGHDRLSTFGLLKHLGKDRVAACIHQLVDAGDLARTEGEYPVITLTAESASVLRNERQARLVEPKLVSATAERQREAKQAAAVPLSPAEEQVREALRLFRKALAAQRSVPPFTVFNDVTLDELTRVRPGSMATMLTVHGLGPRKVEAFGAELLQAVADAVRDAGLALDARAGSRPRPAAELANEETRPIRANAAAAMPMFERGASVEEVSAALSVKPRTASGYLEDFVRARRPADLDPWIPRGTYDRVAAAMAERGGAFLKPVFEALEGSVGYDVLTLVKVHREATANAVTSPDAASPAPAPAER